MARLDISAKGFWGSRFEQADCSAPTNRSQCMSAIYHKHEQEKHRAYEQWVGEIERASFTPMVFAASGEMGKANIVFCTEATSHRPTVPQWDGFAQP